MRLLVIRNNNNKRCENRKKKWGSVCVGGEGGGGERDEEEKIKQKAIIISFGLFFISPCKTRVLFSLCETRQGLDTLYIAVHVLVTVNNSPKCICSHRYLISAYHRLGGCSYGGI